MSMRSLEGCQCMTAGCYTLHLYCGNYDAARPGDHRYGEFPHQFVNEHGGKCRGAAKRAGWVVNYKTGKAICPKCASKLRAKPDHGRAIEAPR